MSKDNAQKTFHWADQYAQRVIRERLDEAGNERESFTCASGITPSGTVHIGNFREIISVDLVARALKHAGKEVRFIYSWDDYDAFRKVPKNMPNQEKLSEYLRYPIVEVPDPWEQEASYARAHEVAVESVLPQVGIEPEYLYQAQRYRESRYAQGMRTALENKALIKSILDQHRKEPLGDDWWPISLFSSFTKKDTTTVLGWDGEWGVTYRCDETGKEETVDLRETGLVKLFWRVDWPMRWKEEGVDFEPAGKEHHSAGGSFDTAKEIAARVYDFKAPVTFKYDFISIKGQGGKISSSLGNVISISDVLEIYQPEIVRYLFASTRPNAEFAISFDLDVIKIYEDYDKCERIAYGVDQVKEDRAAKESRNYELSQVGEKAPTMPYQVPFRHLTTLLLIHEGDAEKALAEVPELVARAKEEGKDGPSWQRSLTRARCAWNWLQSYAPEDFTFTVATPGQTAGSLSPEEATVLKPVVELLKAGIAQFEDKELQNELYAIARGNDFDPKDLFTLMYRLLIGKERGPRLAGFLKNLGADRVVAIIEAYL